MDGRIKVVGLVHRGVMHLCENKDRTNKGVWICAALTFRNCRDLVGSFVFPLKTHRQ